MRHHNTHTKISPHQKLRKEIRAKYLNQVFKIKRAHLITSQLNNIFNQLDHQVNSNALQPVNLVLVNKLLNLFETHCYHSNTYFLIGNYLIDHPLAQRYIIPRILAADKIIRKMAEWQWVIAVALVSNKEFDIEMLKDYDETISNMIDCSNNQDQLRRSLEAFSLLINIQNRDSQAENFMAWFSIEKLELKLGEFEMRFLKQDLKFILVDVCCIVLQHYLRYVEQAPFQYKLNLQAYLPIIILTLCEFPNFRMAYLQIILQISLKHPCYMQHIINDNLLGKQIFKEMFYLMEQTNKFKTTILKIISYWSSMFSFENLMMMVKEGLHLYMIDNTINGKFDFSGKGDIYERESNQDQDFEMSCLCLALTILKTIIDRLRQKGQQKILDGILDDMEQRDFEKWVQQFYLQRHQKDAEQIVTEIIDDYFSDDIQL